MCASCIHNTVVQCCNIGIRRAPDDRASSHQIRVQDDGLCGVAAHYQHLRRGQTRHPQSAAFCPPDSPRHHACYLIQQKVFSFNASYIVGKMNADGDMRKWLVIN